MADRTKAQMLADALDGRASHRWTREEAAAELRRLDAENAALKVEVERLRAAPAPVAQALTDDQIWKAILSRPGMRSEFVASAPTMRRLARAIEQACAEAWGVTLVEATGQEGGKDHG